MTIEKHEIKVTTVGSAGSAVGSTVVGLPLCKLLSVYLDYTSQPGTTDVTIKATGNPAEQTLLTRTNATGDGWFFPKTQDHDNVAAAVTGSYSHPVIHNGGLSVAVAQGDAITDGLVATVYIEV